MDRCRRRRRRRGQHSQHLLLPHLSVTYYRLDIKKSVKKRAREAAVRLKRGKCLNFELLDQFSSDGWCLVNVAAGAYSKFSKTGDGYWVSAGFVQELAHVC